MTPHILIVEDEIALSDAMRYGLEREGFRCTVASDGRSALARFHADRPDLVLLDMMLPELPGEDVCRVIRRTDDTPIIIVSAKDGETDKIIGLELGADDYVTKPFSTRELVARVRTILRRMNADRAPGDVLTAGPIELNVERHELLVNGSRVILRPKEFALLEMLLRRIGRLCTREMLIAEVWGPDYFGDTRTLDVHVKRLRAKIEDDPRAPRILHTVRGLGYKLEAQPDG